MHDQSWLVVVVEVVELFQDLFNFHIDTFVVVSSQIEYELIGWILTENAAEEFVECDQVTMSTLEINKF